MIATLQPEAPAVSAMTHPLDEFYALAEQPLPAMRAVVPEEMPEPQRRLLVHERDMTPTLEQYHGARLHLEVLRSFIHGAYYFRLIVLRRDGDNQAVEFGANCISLNYFSCTARRLIVENYVPLGSILGMLRVKHTNRPRPFFRVQPDSQICAALNLRAPEALYGRKNVMFDPAGHVLSQVIEILPPLREEKAVVLPLPSDGRELG
jgi:hypothetical protein